MSDATISLPSTGPTQSRVKAWQQCEGRSLYLLSNPTSELYRLSLIDIIWTTVTERNEMALRESSHLKYAHAY